MCIYIYVCAYAEEQIRRMVPRNGRKNKLQLEATRERLSIYIYIYIYIYKYYICIHYL